MPPLSSNSSQQCYRSCKGERTVPHFPLTHSRSQVPVKESWAHSFNSSVMETFKAAGNYVRLPVTVLPVSAPLHTTTSLCAAQREVHIEIEFRRELVEKKNQFRQITERMKSTFSSWCASVGRDAWTAYQSSKSLLSFHRSKLKWLLDLDLNLKLPYYIHFSDVHFLHQFDTWKIFVFQSHDQYVSGEIRKCHSFIRF